MDNILKSAQNNYDFFETPYKYAYNIYNDYNPKSKLKVLDICCGLGSLVNPWYENNHNITLIELNKEFIPILKQKYPKANIIEVDFLKMNITDNYDVFLCNPPFNTKDEKRIYVSFFCKILKVMSYSSTLYFICPKMFYKNQNLIRIENRNFNSYQLLDYIKSNNMMPAYYYYDKYNQIELNSNEFAFNKEIIKRMINKNIIDENFIDDGDDGDYTINPYYEFRFLENIFDFKNTGCRCGLFKVNR